MFLRVTRLFYERHVPQDDLLAPLFSRMEPDHPGASPRGSRRCSAAPSSVRSATVAIRT